MGFLLAAILQFLQEDPKPSLPEARRVTVSLDRVPAKTALPDFRRACGFTVEYRGGRYDMTGMYTELEDRPITLKLDRIPFVEAVPRFCQAHGELGFGFGSGPVTLLTIGPNAVPAASYGDLFAFEIGRLEEFLTTDFGEEFRGLWVRFLMWWQPDLRVFKQTGVTLEEAVDDRGNDLRTGKTALVRNEWTLRLPPRDATHIRRLRGFVEIEVPSEVEEITIPVRREAFSPVTIGDYRIEGSAWDLDEGPLWELSVSAAKKDAPFLGITEPRAIRKGGDALPAELYDEPGKAGFRDESCGDVEKLAFKVVKSKTKLKVAFDFKDVKLPRSK